MYYLAHMQYYFTKSRFISIFFLFYRQEDYAQQQREKEKEKKAPLAQPKKEDIKKKAQMESSVITNRMLQAAKTLERMVNQNIFDDISQGNCFQVSSSLKTSSSYFFNHFQIIDIGTIRAMNSRTAKAPYYLYGNFLTKKLRSMTSRTCVSTADITIFLRSLLEHVSGNMYYLFYSFTML